MPLAVPGTVFAPAYRPPRLTASDDPLSGVMGGSRSFARRGRRGKPMFRCPLLAFIVQQVRRSGLQGFGKFRDDGDRRIPNLPFDAGDVGSVDLRPRRKFFLREVQPFPGRLYVPGEYGAHIFHARYSSGMKTISPRTMSLILLSIFV